MQVDPLTDERWNDYVSRHPAALVFHHASWLRCLQSENGQRPRGLAILADEAEFAAVLPLLPARGLPLPRAGAVVGRRLSSLPRTPVAGPLAHGREQLRRLVHAAAMQASSVPGTQLQLKPAEPTLDGLVEGIVPSPWRLTYVLDLPDDPDLLRFGDARHTSRVRWSIKHALREGVRVREATSLDQLRVWHLIYLHTMRHHVVPPRPLRLFEAMWRELRPSGLMRLILAMRGEEVIGGSVLLMFGRTVFYAFGAARRTALSLRPQDVLQWEAIHQAIREGYRHYDLGEVVEGQEGLAQFKRKWGAEPRRLVRYYGPVPAAPPDRPTLSLPRGGRVARTCWRHLPLRVTAAVGSLAYRML